MKKRRMFATALLLLCAVRNAKAQERPAPAVDLTAAWIGFADDSVASEGAFTAGGGIRSRIADRVSIGVDARVGWELHIRIGGFVAISVGR